MQSRWIENEAGGFVERFAARWGPDLALRVYTSRLLGAEPHLVLHGGGNTSVKTVVRDLLGEERSVICVKGSGQDLATIEPRQLPALDLRGLSRLRSLDALADADMVNQLRTHLLDAASPTPSIETLLHVFLPDKFVDHTHADAALVYGNRPEGGAELAHALGAEVGVLPWIRPGLPLAKAAAEFREQHPEAIGLVVRQHGVFSWGPDARTSYERQIEIVDRVEHAIRGRLQGRTTLLDVEVTVAESDARSVAVEVAPLLRRLLADPSGDALRPRRPLILEWRPTREALAAADAREAPSLFRTAPLTPDHVIRTKAHYVVSGPTEGELSDAVTAFRADYHAYFEQGAQGTPEELRMHDPYPRVVLVKGGGLFAWGPTKQAARIAADIAEPTIRGKVLARALSSYESLPDRELFEIEYWSLERAKLGSAGEPALARQIALVTGAAGALGLAISRKLLQRGAHVVLADLDAGALERAAELLAEPFGSAVHSVVMDVTDERSVRRGFEECVLRFGGLDVLVANAGVAHVAAIADLELADWERVIRVNETGTFLCFREAARILGRQKLGGRLILNASKNVPSPGADFAAYSASKAAAVQIARVAALELAAHGILVNMVHPDAVFEDAASGQSSGLWNTVGAERMRSRGMSPEKLREHYRQRNLLGVAVTAEHVAEAVAFFAAGRTPTTGAALTVDGGLKETFYR